MNAARCGARPRTRRWRAARAGRTILALCALAATATPQNTASILPGEEGPLANNAWLPLAPAVEQELGNGDQLYAALVRAHSPTSNSEITAYAREWGLVFDAWRAALGASQPGDAVTPRPVPAQARGASPWPDPDGTASRRTEGVEAAVAWRLEVLPDALRTLWSERFDPLASAALEIAFGDPGRLARVERDFPDTRAAALAALSLAELDLERARPALARAWLARCATHRAPSIGAEVAKAIELRRAACDARAPLPPPPSAGSTSWTVARELDLVETIPVLTRETRSRLRQNSTKRTGAAKGVLPGLVFLGADRALVHFAELVALVDIGRATAATQAPGDLLNPLDIVEPPASSASRTWPLLPASDGRAVVLVHGELGEIQSLFHPERRDQRSNVVLCLEPSGVGDAAPLRVRWCALLDRTVDRDKQSTPWPEELALTGGEFQPGPLIVAGLAIVQVRRATPGAGSEEASTRASGAEIESWIVALDLARGTPVWTRLVGKGTELARDLGRFTALSTRTASPPLALVDGGRVFAASGLGTAALLDSLDGRIVWTFRNRRREAEARGWAACARPAVLADPPGVLWDPPDSDFLYWLRADGPRYWLRAEGPGHGSLADGPGAAAGLYLRAPRAISEAEALLGGDASSALVLSHSGASRVLSAWDVASGGRRDGLAIEGLERFGGAGLVSERRALFATDRRLYLCDRERGGWLLDEEPLPGAGSRGGSVFAQGDRVIVVGERGVWIFRVLR